MAELNIQFVGVDYDPPIYNRVNISFGSPVADPGDYYKPPRYKHVNFKLDVPLTETDGAILNFKFVEVPNPCADWVDQDGDSLTVSYTNCKSDWWSYSQSNLLKVSFDCCELVTPCDMKRDVLWYAQQSNNLYTNFTNCEEIPDYRDSNSLNYDVTDFSLDYVPAIPGIRCYDTHEAQVGDGISFNFNSCTGLPDFVVNGDIDFECCDDNPPECEPDFIQYPGNAVNPNINSCNGKPDFKQFDGNSVEVNVDCCGDEPIECEPDFEYQNGGNVVIDMDRCDTDGNYVTQNGGNVEISFDCCEVLPPVDVIYANGIVQVVDLTIQGVAEHVNAISVGGLFNPLVITSQGVAEFTNIATATGNVIFGFNANGAAERGQRVLDSNATFSPIVVSGQATWSPEVFNLSGNVRFNITASGSAAAFTYINAVGDVKFNMGITGVVMAVVMASGEPSIGEIKSVGDVDVTLVTVQPSNVKFGEITASGDANFNLIPTTLPANIPLDIKVNGAAAYIDLPTLWGDVKFDITVQQPEAPVQTGVYVYWSNIRLSMGVNGVATHPIYVQDSNVKLGEIGVTSDVAVSVAGSVTDTKLGEIVVNRGWIEFGDPQAPEARQIYEASNVRSNVVRSYPLDSKFAIYVPTSDYTLHDVQLRRGTVDYTIEFNFDALQVEKVVVWLVDQYGNSVQDSIAKYVGGATSPHVIAEPFTNLYNLSIPVHCVNDSKYQFYLEVVYESEMFDGTVVFPRKSYLVPFQAHFDNRNPYLNSTDKISSIDACYKSLTDGAMEITTTEFAATTQFFEENLRIHASNSFENMWETATVSLTIQSISYSDTITIPYFNSVNPTMETKYYELDIGQIGG